VCWLRTQQYARPERTNHDATAPTKSPYELVTKSSCIDRVRIINTQNLSLIRQNKSHDCDSGRVNAVKQNDPTSLNLRPRPVHFYFRGLEDWRRGVSASQ